MKPFEMRNLPTFPIERLSFDLKLEVLEELDAKDVVELVKVNHGFHWMISHRPSIVLGHHVHEIDCCFFQIRIKKLPDSFPIIRDFPFMKNIRSCKDLSVRNYSRSRVNEDHAAFLKQLKAVNSFLVCGCAPQNLEFFSHLSIKEYAYLDIDRPLEAPSKKALVEHFIETQLSECKEVEMLCDNDGDFHFYYNTSIKTHIKRVEFLSHGSINLVGAIQYLVSHGISSKNPAADCLFRVFDTLTPNMKATIVAFLKGYPGMKEIGKENHQTLIALVNDRWEGDKFNAIPKKTFCFRRSIDATRDCIYMFYSDTNFPRFFAFYIKPDETIDLYLFDILLFYSL